MFSIKEYHKKYYQNHKKKKREQAKKYYYSHKKKRSEHSKIYRDGKRKFLLGFLGGKCIRCSLDDERTLCFDHINSDGAEDRKRFTNPTNMINYYIHHLEEVKQNLQVLCANCNMIKARELGEFKGRSS